MPQLKCLRKLPTFDKFSLELLFIYFRPQIGDDVLQKLIDGNTNFHKTVNDKVHQSLFLFNGLYSVTQHGAMMMIWSKVFLVGNGIELHYPVYSIP